VIFGGTRGKFNGLDLFESVSDDKNKRKVRKRRIPPSYYDEHENNEDYYDIEDDYMDYDDEKNRRRRSNNIIKKETKDNNNKSSSRSSNKNFSIVLSSTGPITTKNKRSTANINPWKNEVSSWFQEKSDDNTNNNENNIDKNNEEDQSSKEDLKSSIDNLLDTLFLVDTQERQQMEDLYNKNMKLGKYNNKKKNKSPSKDVKTFKYRDDGILPVADFATILPEEREERQEESNTNTTASTTTSSKTTKTIQIDTKLEKLNAIKKDLEYIYTKLNHHKYIKESIIYRIQDANEELTLLNNDLLYLKQQMRILSSNERRVHDKIQKEIYNLNMQMEDTSRYLRYETTKLNIQDDKIHDIQLDYDDLILYCLEGCFDDDNDKNEKEDFLKWIYSLEHSSSDNNDDIVNVEIANDSSDV